MTESEWRECGDPHELLRFIVERASDRKLQLFACACCRASWPQGIGPTNEALFAVAESYADGTVFREALRARWGDGPSAGRSWPESPVEWATGMARPRSPAQRQRRAILARCIFGDPFHEATILSAWRTDEIVRIAWSAYQERHLPGGHLDNARLAVLSDALEEAGCTDATLLTHLRSPGPHVRGCWPIDLLLAMG